MEVGTEISQKIRSAIKAKLIELGAYVDDELPDYIMVMVANKKSREQMISDLSLFLGKNTDVFAEWLHGLLSKLQTLSVDSNAAKSVKEKKKSVSKKDKKSKKSGKTEGSSQVKKVKSNKGETSETANDKSTELKSKGLTDDEQKDAQGVQNEGKEPLLEAEVEDVRQMLVTVAPTDELAAELETTEVRIEQSQQIASQIRKSGNSESEKVKSAVRTTERKGKRSASPNENERRVQSSSAPKKYKGKGLTSVVASVSKDMEDEEEEEYDPLCPAVGNVASVVKVTNRRSKVPPALQANKALLVKAMGEAERSIAIKRRIIGPRQTHREDSPSEVYTPKRKKSSGDPEPSPPPYIPSRKESSSAGTAKVSSNPVSQPEVGRRRDHSDSRSEHARQTLSSQDRHDLMSRSRRMELLKHIGIDRNEGPVRGKSNSNVKRTGQSPKKMDTRKIAEHDQRLKLSGSSMREVSGRRREDDDDDGDVKDLKIKARLGPIVRTTSSESRKAPVVTGGRSGGGLDLRNKMTRSTYNEDGSLQIIVNPMTSPALKGSVASRLGKIVVKRSGSGSDNDDDDDDVSNSICEVKAKTRKAVSRLAKSSVIKQCQEAAMSVNAGVRRRRRSASPDSRRVEASNDDGDDCDEKEEEEEEEDVVKKSNVVVEGKSVSVTVKQSVMDKYRTTVVDDNDKVVNNPGEEDYGKDDGDDEERKSEDLEDMIGEKLEPELLNDSGKDILDLDLESEDVDDIETMIGVKSEEDKPKLGTRFIVTLDGVDERQLCAENESGAGGAKDTNPFIQPRSMAVDPMQKISPAAAPLYIPQLKVLPAPQRMALPVGIPMQAAPSPPIIAGVPTAPFSPIVYNMRDSQCLPPPAMASIIPQEELPTDNKPLPPKIQPFSINLKDSDDEFEDSEARMQMRASASGSYISQVRQTHSDTSLATLSALQKAKMSERCKYWPACAVGSECEFHHPTSYCKTFPNCKFADKCLFIHPNCRFDSRCTRQDCPYTHTSRRPGLSSSLMASSSSVPTIPFRAPKPPPAPVPSTTTICRFYPNCQNPSCLFIHPKPCRFGAACQNPSCLFYHPTPPVVVPNKDKLKWKSQAVLTTHQPKDISSSSSTSLSTIDPAAKFRQPVAKVSPMSAVTSSSNAH